jgi:hypothetical protein
MTRLVFVKHPSYRGYWVTRCNGIVYNVLKSSFGWHAQFENGAHVGDVVFVTRREAEDVCNKHAGKE